MKVLIVDDEARACKNLEHILKENHADSIRIAGVAHNTLEAETLIKETRPDAVFMDIEMPGENGCHFLERLAPFDFDVIFATAYDAFAIKAFKLNAVDYILKPIGAAEVGQAVLKLKERHSIRHLKNNKEMYGELNQLLSGSKQAHKIILRENNNIEAVLFRDIIYIEGKGSYSNVCFRNKGNTRNMLVSHHIAVYETLLPMSRFFRTHKSYIVNSDHIDKVSAGKSGYTVMLKDGHCLPVGRRRYTELLSFLKNTIA